MHGDDLGLAAVLLAEHPRHAHGLPLVQDEVFRMGHKGIGLILGQGLKHFQLLGAEVEIVKLAVDRPPHILHGLGRLSLRRSYFTVLPGESAHIGRGIRRVGGPGIGRRGCGRHGGPGAAGQQQRADQKQKDRLSHMKTPFECTHY